MARSTVSVERFPRHENNNPSNPPTMPTDQNDHPLEGRLADQLCQPESQLEQAIATAQGLADTLKSLKTQALSKSKRDTLTDSLLASSGCQCRKIDTSSKPSSYIVGLEKELQNAREMIKEMNDAHQLELQRFEERKMELKKMHHDRLVEQQYLKRRNEELEKMDTEHRLEQHHMKERIEQLENMDQENQLALRNLKEKNEELENSTFDLIRKRRQEKQSLQKVYQANAKLQSAVEEEKQKELKSENAKLQSRLKNALSDAAEYEQTATARIKSLRIENQSMVDQMNLYRDMGIYPPRPSSTKPLSPPPKVEKPLPNPVAVSTKSLSPPPMVKKPLPKPLATNTRVTDSESTTCVSKPTGKPRTRGNDGSVTPRTPGREVTKSAQSVRDASGTLSDSSPAPATPQHPPRTSSLPTSVAEDQQHTPHGSNFPDWAPKRHEGGSGISIFPAIPEPRVIQPSADRAKTMSPPVSEPTDYKKKAGKRKSLSSFKAVTSRTWDRLSALPSKQNLRNFASEIRARAVNPVIYGEAM